VGIPQSTALRATTSRSEIHSRRLINGLLAARQLSTCAGTSSFSDGGGVVLRHASLRTHLAPSTLQRGAALRHAVTLISSQRCTQPTVGQFVAKQRASSWQATNDSPA
jgi:hypothetical protein